jgi:hypothetical protein
MFEVIFLLQLRFTHHTTAVQRQDKLYCRKLFLEYAKVLFFNNIIKLRGAITLPAREYKQYILSFDKEEL